MLGSNREERVMYLRRGDVCLPVALSAAVLLGLLGVGISETTFGEVVREMFLWHSSAVSKAGMVLVVVLVGASH